MGTTNRNAPLLAGLSLVAAQIAIGLTYKYAALSGPKQSGYGFSTASSLAISEMIKFLMSFGLYCAKIGEIVLNFD